jgi:DNA modification methylase
MGQMQDICNKQKTYKTPILENIVPLNRGDVFEIGNHRLIYGDATNKNDIEKLMNKKLADMIFTDPPFNLDNDKVGSITSNSNFIMGGGEMSVDEFTDFLTKIADNLYNFSANNSVHYICINWKNIQPLMTATSNYDKYKALIIWDKKVAGIGGFYRSQYELIFVFQKGKKSCVQNFSFKDYRSNIWRFDGQGVFGFDKKQGIERFHPTMKPIKLVADAIKDCSNEGDIILDLFGGSGTTMIASHLTNRACFMAELDEKYCNAIIRRMLKLDDNLKIISNEKDVTEMFLMG